MRTTYGEPGITYGEPGLRYDGLRDDEQPPDSSWTFFLTPIATFAKVPQWPRVPEITNRSEAYRHFYANQVGTDVEIDGITYRGGYWNGPLSAAEVTAIRNAGYGARIRSIQPERYEQLPATLDGPLP